MGFFANSTVGEHQARDLPVPERSAEHVPDQPRSTPGASLSGPVFTKGNYGVSWGNTFWGQDSMPVSSFSGRADDRSDDRRSAVFRKSAFGFYTIGMSPLTDGSSNTVFIAEVLQGET